MSIQRSTFFKWAAAATVAAGALFAAGTASAQVSWSVGVNAPGIAVGVGQPGYGYYAPPAPVYYAPPPPVYYRPAPVYYAPPPVYYGPPRGYYRPGPGYGHGHGHRGHGHWR